MKIDVLWTPGELEQVQVQDRTAVLVDVLRSGTTVATAIHNGARAVVPAASTEEAIRIAQSIGRRDVLLCGERGGEPIEGFDLGNSPSEFTPDVVSDRTLVMSTTNGTHTLVALSAAGSVYVGALVNLRALAERLADVDGDPVVVCAGRRGRVSVEDALCAGLLVDATIKQARRRKLARPQLGDGAIAARALASELPPDVRFLRRTTAGRSLRDIGQGEDIKFCARVDSLSVVPVLRERQIVRHDAVGVAGNGGKKRDG
jgi:2-phosphosulfolactate phosphatase